MPNVPNVSKNDTELSMDEVQRRLAILQLRKMEQEVVDEANQVTQRENFRRQVALEAKKKREEDLVKQELCNHRKPNNASAVVGYRSHQHMEQWICQNCFKEWQGIEVPSSLRPPNTEVGGPM